MKNKQPHPEFEHAYLFLTTHENIYICLLLFLTLYHCFFLTLYPNIYTFKFIGYKNATIENFMYQSISEL